MRAARPPSDGGDERDRDLTGLRRPSDTSCGFTFAIYGGKRQHRPRDEYLFEAQYILSFKVILNLLPERSRELRAFARSRT